MKKLMTSLGLALGVGLCAAPASGAITVTFTPSSQHIGIGESASVEVSIAGLGPEILSGFDLNFLFDGTVLDWNAAIGSPVYGQLGNDYGTAPLFTFDTLSDGDIGAQASALVDDATVAANQDDAFLMFRFGLTGHQDGVSTFGLGLDPDFQRNFVGLNAQTLNVVVGDACIAVGTGSCPQLPEPSTYALVALALAGAFAAGARRRRQGPTQA